MPLDLLKGLILVSAGANCLAVRHVYATGIRAGYDHSAYFAFHHRTARRIALQTFVVFLALVEILRILAPSMQPYLKYAYTVHVTAATLLVVVAIFIFQIKNGEKDRGGHKKWVWRAFAPLYVFMMVSGAGLVILR